VRPRYADWEKRQRRAVELYRRGLEPREVARRMRLSPTTVWRYLRLAGEPRHTALSVPNVSVLPRPPFWALHERLGSCEVVCGRKFCSRCGRWRHLADFPRDSHKRGVALSHCAACQKAVRRYGYHHETEAQRANRRERHRMFYNGQRRQAGIPESTAQRVTVIDRIEGTRLPLEPLLVELRRVDRAELARRAGIDETSIRRLTNGVSAHVRIDLADRLAVALGIPSAIIWGELW